VDTLVYDGDCGICQEAVRLLDRLGCRALPVPSHEWVRTHPEDAERCASSVLLVFSDGSSLESERAITGLLRLSRGPGPWLAALIELPGVRTVAHHLYRYVADHRTRISAALGMTACTVDDHPPAGDRA